MPPRDEQDYEQRRQQIIDGALEVFSNKGFDSASNKEIAEAAKIGSPGLIYHYFKDKVDLLHQVILTRMPLLRLIDETETMLDLPPEVVLPQLCERLLEAYGQWPASALMKVVLAESLRSTRVAQMINEIGPGRGLRVIAAYLSHQMDLGRLRRINPDLAARALLGPTLAYAATRAIFDQAETKAIPPKEMAAQSAAIFLRGMAPETPTPSAG
jgi:AcrR family transcriptional regulator